MISGLICTKNYRPIFAYDLKNLQIYTENGNHEQISETDT